MYKHLVAIASAAIITAGCVTTAPVNSYRPRGSNDAAWMVGGSFNELSGKVIVTINGAEVISGRVSLWDGSGQFFGQYQSHQVAARCHKVEKFLADPYEQCAVLVDGERASVLHF